MADYEIVFYEEGGGCPFARFLDGLDLTRRLAMLAALEQILAEQGQDVCRSSWGKALGGGLFEFRVRHTAAEIRRLFGGDPPAQPGDHEGPPGKVVLRAFCHAHGDKVVLLLGGYDKGADPSTKRQQKEIATARTRLKRYLEADRRAREKR